MDIQNKVGSWFLNNNPRVLEEVRESSYKRFLTLVSLVEISYRKTYNKKLYPDPPRRDGIVISIPRLMPSFTSKDLDKEVLDLVVKVNEDYGDLCQDDLDHLHKRVLDMFDDPGFLKI